MATGTIIHDDDFNFEVSGNAWLTMGANTTAIDLSKWKYLTVSIYEAYGGTNYFSSHEIYLLNSMSSFPYRLVLTCVESVNISIAYNPSTHALTVSTFGTSPSYSPQWRACGHN